MNVRKGPPMTDFAVKTPPQHGTWQEFLDVWRAVDQCDEFAQAWHFDHFYPLIGDTHGPASRGWTMLSVLAAGDQPHPHRQHGERHALPPPRCHRQHGRHPRHHLRRTPRSRHGCGMEPAGVQRLRHRARLDHGPPRPLRGGRGGDRPPPVAGGDRLPGQVLHDHDAPCEPKPSSSPTRRC